MEMEIPIILDKIVYREIKLQGVFSHDSQSVVQAIQLAELKTRKIK